MLSSTLVPVLANWTLRQARETQTEPKGGDTASGREESGFARFRPPPSKRVLHESDATPGLLLTGYAVCRAASCSSRSSRHTAARGDLSLRRLEAVPPAHRCARWNTGRGHRGEGAQGARHDLGGGGRGQPRPQSRLRRHPGLFLPDQRGVPVDELGPLRRSSMLASDRKAATLEAAPTLKNNSAKEAHARVSPKLHFSFDPGRSDQPDPELRRPVAGRGHHYRASYARRSKPMRVSVSGKSWPRFAALRDRGVSKSHNDYPTVDIRMKIDRMLAGQLGNDCGRAIGSPSSPSTASSRFVAPNYWRDPRSGVSATRCRSRSRKRR